MPATIAAVLRASMGPTVTKKVSVSVWVCRECNDGDILCIIYEVKLMFTTLREYIKTPQALYITLF